MKIVDWYYGTEEDRALMRMWCALRLPVEHRCGLSARWYPVGYETEDKLNSFLKITSHAPGGDKFYDHIQFRLKPCE